jgi:hypothetical protein
LDVPCPAFRSTTSSAGVIAIRLFATAVVVLAASAAVGQSDAFPISTNRPSFSDTGTLVPLDHPQIEGGATFARVGRSEAWALGEFMFRQRIADRLEVRLSNLSYGLADDGTRAFLDPSVGMVYRFQTGTSRRPELALLGYVTVPNSSPLGTEVAQPTVKLSYYQQLDAQTGVGGNLNAGQIGAGDGRFSQWATAIYLTRSLTPRTGSYLEFYRVMPIAEGGRYADFVNGGPTYLVNRRTQVDVRIGSGFNSGRDGWFAGVGFGYRF